MTGMYKYLRIIHVKNQNIPKNETIGHWMWSFFDDSENTLDAKLPQKWSWQTWITIFPAKRADF